MLSTSLNPLLRGRLERRFRQFHVARSASVACARIRGGEGCSLTVAAESYVRAQLVFERAGALIQIGERTFIGAAHLIAASSIIIGDDVLVSWNVTVVDHHSHSLRFSERSKDVTSWTKGQKDWRFVKTAPIEIQSKVWIGFGASILSGVTVGCGAVVGACSVVTGDIPPWTVWAGNPARQIRELGIDER